MITLLLLDGGADGAGQFLVSESLTQLVDSGEVVEFYDEVIEDRQKAIAEKYDFTITGHTMVLYGHFNKNDKNS